MKPRIWHVCECTYSTKSEEHLVLVFGGAVDNMFDRLDSEVTVIGDTVLLKFGMQINIVIHLFEDNSSIYLQ